MVLRSAVPTDAALLAALHSQGFRDAWNEQAFATLLATPGTFGLLAGTDQPLGFILCRAAADEAEILTLFVPEPHRRTGVATALIGRAADLARGAGVTALFLEVADDNESARALCRHRLRRGRPPPALLSGQDRRGHDETGDRRGARSRRQVAAEEKLKRVG